MEKAFRRYFELGWLIETSEGNQKILYQIEQDGLKHWLQREVGII